MPAAHRSQGLLGRPRAVIVSAVFPPEATYTAMTSRDIAEGLVGRGYEVTVLAPFPSHPAKKVFPGYQRRLYALEEGPGYRVIHCFSFLSPRSTLLGRSIENLSFGITSAAYLLGCRRPAVIYANSWPVLAASMIAAVARIRKIPLVTSVQDMYPESLYAQGRMSDTNPVARAMRRIDRWVARNSALLFVAARNFQRAYMEDRGIDAGKIKVVLNWGDAERVKIDPEASAEFRRAKGIPAEPTLAVYGGNVGVASGIETLVKAFALLGDCTDAYLLIAGEGNNLDRCRQIAEASGCGRVFFHSPWPNQETALVLGAADILLLPTRGNQSLASVPSKLISYMFAGRPVLALAQAGAEIRNTIEAAQCGWVIAPDQPEEAAAALRKVVASDKPTLRRMGESGRRFALKHMSREHSVPYVLDLLAQLAGPVGQANHREAACVPESGPVHVSKVD